MNPYRITVILAVAGLVLLSVWNSVAYFLEVRQNYLSAPPGSDMVSTWDRRLRDLRRDLPPHGVVGYVADWDIPGKTGTSSDQTVEFLLSQYSLAPLILQRGSNHDLIIGNFSFTGDLTRVGNILRELGLVVVKEHTAEIFLLRNNPQ